MTQPDPAAQFRRNVAGKTVPIRFEAGPVETLDGQPRGVEPATTVVYAFDADGYQIPTWETDEPTQGAEDE